MFSRIAVLALGTVFFAHLWLGANAPVSQLKKLQTQHEKMMDLRRDEAR